MEPTIKKVEMLGRGQIFYPFNSETVKDKPST